MHKLKSAASILIAVTLLTKIPLTLAIETGAAPQRTFFLAVITGASLLSACACSIAGSMLTAEK